jgi:hypothetical protein
MKKPQTAGQWIGTITGVLVLLGALLKGVVWAGNTQWVTHGGLAQIFNSWRLAQLNDSIWDIETKRKLGESTKFDELKIERLQDQRAELLQ